MQSFVDICNENLSSSEVRKICDRIQDESVQSLSLRDVTLTDKDYKHVVKSVSASRTIRHLSFSVGIITDSFRVQILAKGIQNNTSLTGLFLHGNTIDDAGMKTIHQSLSVHPSIASLDLGDCEIGDEAVDIICSLLADSNKRRGLQELVLSHNPDITSKGWAKLGIAIAAGNNLRTLHVDYNEMGDSSASCLLIAIAGTKCMENLDMECIGATEATGQVLLHLVQNYRMRFKYINLKENQVSDSTIEEIKLYLPELVDTEENNDLPSDEEPSLAMSEPPLNDHGLMEDFDNTDVTSIGIVSTQEFPITIVGTIFSVVNTPDTGEDNTDETNDARPNNLPSKSTKPIKVAGGTLAERVMSKSAIISDQNKTQHVETKMTNLQSRSLSGIKKESTSVTISDLLVQNADNESRAYVSAEALRPTGDSVSTTVQIIEQVEDIEYDDTKSTCSVLIHETPSVVSLHKYEESMRGHDDVSFHPVESLFSTRPTSAPVPKHRKADKQTRVNDTSIGKPGGSKLGDRLTVRDHSARRKSEELHVRDTRRRLSDASVFCVTKELREAREHMSRASVHDRDSKNHDFTDSKTSVLGDVELEEM